MHLDHGLIELPKNHGWERVVSPFNVFKTMDGREWFQFNVFKTMDGGGWFPHLMLL